MGNWKMEVGRMAFYMTFPVALFHVFNQPELFEEWVTNTRRLMYPPEDRALRQELTDLITDMRRKTNEEMLAAIQANDNKNNN